MEPAQTNELELIENQSTLQNLISKDVLITLFCLIRFDLTDVKGLTG